MFAYPLDGPGKGKAAESLRPPVQPSLTIRRPARSTSGHLAQHSAPTSGGSRSARVSAIEQTSNSLDRRPEQALCGGARPGEEALLAPQVMVGRLGDVHRDDLPGSRQAGEIHDLVVPRAATQARGVGARRALDEHV